jgi:hypothetical protein
MPTTEAETINADLLAWLRSDAPAMGQHNNQPEVVAGRA